MWKRGTRPRISGIAGEPIEHLRALIEEDGLLYHAYRNPQAPIVGHAKGNYDTAQRVTLWHPPPDPVRDALMRMQPEEAAKALAAWGLTEWTALHG